MCAMCGSEPLFTAHQVAGCIATHFVPCNANADIARDELRRIGCDLIAIERDALSDGKCHVWTQSSRVQYRWFGLKCGWQFVIFTISAGIVWQRCRRTLGKYAASHRRCRGAPSFAVVVLTDMGCSHRPNHSECDAMRYFSTYQITPILFLRLTHSRRPRSHA